MAHLRLPLLAASVLLLAWFAQPVAAVGGPDLDNYLWISQDDDNGPKYDWVEISATGTKADMQTCPSMYSYYGPSTSAPVDLGFGKPFKHYDREYSQAYISLFGNIRFEPAQSIYYGYYSDCDFMFSGQCGIATSASWFYCDKGSATTPNYQIGAFWSSFGLNVSDPKSGVYYQTICPDGGPASGCTGNHIFIVEWNNLQACPVYQTTNQICYEYSYQPYTCGAVTCVPDPTAPPIWYYKAEGPNTFEAKIYENKRNMIEVHYKTAKKPSGMYPYQAITMGIEGSGKKVGKLYHGLAYKNVGQAYGSSTFKPKAKWAIRYVHDAPPKANMSVYAIPASIYHNGVADDDSVALPNPEPSYFHASNQILFNDRSTDTDGAADIVNWTWDLGDGNVSFVQNPTHSYADVGDYIFKVNVTLRVADDFLGSKTVFKILDFYPNVGPTTDFSAPAVTRALSPVTLSDISQDTDGKIMQWFWDFGDNEQQRLPMGVTDTVLNGTVAHTYEKTGVYTITLKTVDDDGAVAIASHTITVEPAVGSLIDSFDDPPRAFAGEAQTVAPGTVVQMHGYQTNGHAEVYRWSQVAGPRVELRDAATGDPSFVAPSLYTDSDGHAIPARIVMELQVTDQSRTSEPATVTYTVAPRNLGPVAIAGADQRVAPLDIVTLDGSASHDPDGNPVTVAWTQVTGPTVTITPLDATHATFTAPNLDGTTELAFLATATDGKGGSSTSSVRVTIAPGMEGFAANARDADTFAFTANKVGAEYTWDFGDGATSHQAAPVHSYAASGTYGVSLSLTDLDGNTHTYTRAVTAYTANAAEKASSEGRQASALMPLTVLLALGAIVLLRRRDL